MARDGEQRVPAGREAGFNLVIISLLMTVAGLMIAAEMVNGRGNDLPSKMLNTVNNLSHVEQALTSFMIAHGRLPCPADGQYRENTANFGVEAANPGTCTGGTPVVPLGPDAGTGHIVGGTIPTRALHLDDSYAYDEWGRRVTYVVDARATQTASCLTLENSPYYTGTGGIQIEKTNGGPVIENVMHAFISHGPSGHGAWPAQGSSNALSAAQSAASRMNAGNTSDVDKLVNAGVDSGFNYSTANFTNVKVMKDRNPTTGFDDIVYYAQYQKNACCLGPACISYGIRIDGTQTNMNLQLMNTVDVNGDGIPDLILWGQDTNGANDIFVVFGKGGGITPNPFLVPTDLNGANGFEITGVGAYYAGHWFQVVPGDFNGDGIKDLIIIDEFGNGLASRIYLVFGQNGGWPASIDASSLNATSNPKGLLLTTAGVTIAAAGDVNGATNGSHNIDDIVLGAPAGSGPPGIVYVIFGNATISSIATSGGVPVLNGTNGFTITGWGGGDSVGDSLALADLNGDGKKDIVIGAEDFQGTWSGVASYANEVGVIWGQSSFTFTSGSNIALNALNANGSQGFLFTELSAGDNGWIPNSFRTPALVAGDVNGDGTDDIQMGFADNNREASWGIPPGVLGPGIVATLFGNKSWTAPNFLGTNSFDLTALNGTNGTVLAASPNWCAETPVGALYYPGLGVSPSLIADINGDGKNSLLRNGPGISSGFHTGSGTAR